MTMCSCGDEVPVNDGSIKLAHRRSAPVPGRRLEGSPHRLGACRTIPGDAIVPRLRIKIRIVDQMRHGRSGHTGGPGEYAMDVDPVFARIVERIPASAQLQTPLTIGRGQSARQRSRGRAPPCHSTRFRSMKLRSSARAPSSTSVLLPANSAESRAIRAYLGLAS